MRKHYVSIDITFGVRATSKKTGIEIYGALDDLWLNKDTDEIVVLDKDNSYKYP